MSFARPYVLVGLAAPLALLVWRLRGGGFRLALPFDHSGGKRGLGWAVLLEAGAHLPALLLAVAVVLAAGPLRWSEPRTQRVLTNIEFCLDVSGSMTAPFGDGSRYDAAMGAINEFIDTRAGDAFGLTVFGNQVLHWIPVTQDVSAFRCAPPFLRPETLPSWFGGTEIGKALLACRKVLIQREEGDRMILLVSDGYSWDLSNGRDQEIADRLAADGIVVYAVHVADGDPPVELTVVTQGTGGDVFAAGDTAGLEVVFRRIDSMQKTRIEVAAAEAIDHFAPIAWSGLALLASLALFGLGLRYTPW